MRNGGLNSGRWAANAPRTADLAAKRYILIITLCVLGSIFAFLNSMYRIPRLDHDQDVVKDVLTSARQEQEALPETAEYHLSDFGLVRGNHLCPPSLDSLDQLRELAGEKKAGTGSQDDALFQRLGERQAFTDATLSYFAPAQGKGERKGQRGGEAANEQRDVPSKYAASDVGVFPDAWVGELCPEVVSYFRDQRVNYFSFHDRSLQVTALTTEAAASEVCLLKVCDLVAKQVGTTCMLWAGSHLGAVLHGGPIPWDDDIDVIVPFDYLDRFVSACRGFTVGDMKFHCEPMLNAVKIWPEGYPGTQKKMGWPFVDAFMWKNDTKNGVAGIREAWVTHLEQELNIFWPSEAIFPMREYPFAGTMLMGPSLKIAQRRYNFDACRAPGGSHRHGGLPRDCTYLGTGQEHKAACRRADSKAQPALDCCRLSEHFPFVHRVPSAAAHEGRGLEILAVNDRVIHVTEVDAVTGQVLRHGDADSMARELGIVRENQAERSLTYTHAETGLTTNLPLAAWEMEKATSLWGSSIEDRKAWAEGAGDKELQTLYTTTFGNLTQVEIDNSISPFFRPPSRPAAMGGADDAAATTVKVLAFNAARGTHWLPFAETVRETVALQNPDIIILNEMDIGMARSENLHTTRMLAFELGMNYAWGLEFVELTNGNEEEQQRTRGQDNTLGLHGNAILSKARLFDPRIVRNDLEGGYYSAKPGFTNAQGFEKRLAARMGLFVSISWPLPDAPLHSILIGSVHKVDENRFSRVRDVVAKAVAGGGSVVMGGDQGAAIAGAAGSGVVSVSGKGSTVPATCSPPYDGRHRGDRIFSNLAVSQAEVTLRPCFSFTAETAPHGRKQKRPQLLLSDHAVLGIVLQLTSRNGG